MTVLPEKYQARFDANFLWAIAKNLARKLEDALVKDPDAKQVTITFETEELRIITQMLFAKAKSKYRISKQ
jgi:hypothetical protein